MWRKIHIRAIDSISGESLCFVVFGWRVYKLLNFTCARKIDTLQTGN